jgi:hypothetical protein
VSLCSDRHSRQRCSRLISVSLGGRSLTLLIYDLFLNVFVSWIAFLRRTERLGLTVSLLCPRLDQLTSLFVWPILTSKCTSTVLFPPIL